MHDTFIEEEEEEGHVPSSGGLSSSAFHVPSSEDLSSSAFRVPSSEDLSSSAFQGEVVAYLWGE